MDHSCFARFLPLPVVLLAACTGGCLGRHSPEPPSPPPGEGSVAPGITYRAIPATDPLTHGSSVWLIEADLRRSGVSVGVAYSGLRARESPRYGDARTVVDWCATTGAVAAVNGGYFGDGSRARKEIVGLLAGDGTVLSGAEQRKGSRGAYVRSVFGVSRAGVPAIRWATGRRGGAARLALFAGPERASRYDTWRVREAVGCGPTLVHDGVVRVTDRQERLVSRGRLHRTFLGYSVRAGRPDLLVMTVGQRMEYTDAAAFIAGYFRREHGTVCDAAMCLDGGGSSQLAYVTKDGVQVPAPSPVTVPTAVVAYSRR